LSREGPILICRRRGSMSIATARCALALCHDRGKPGGSMPGPAPHKLQVSTNHQEIGHLRRILVGGESGGREPPRMLGKWFRLPGCQWAQSVHGRVVHPASCMMRYSVKRVAACQAFEPPSKALIRQKLGGSRNHRRTRPPRGQN
jgi:hypothetical protein